MSNRYRHRGTEESPLSSAAAASPLQSVGDIPQPEGDVKEVAGCGTAHTASHGIRASQPPTSVNSRRSADEDRACLLSGESDNNNRGDIG